LAGGDNLAVRGFEVEAELAGAVLADLELGRHRFSLGLGVVGHHVNNVDQRMSIVPD
jgi:hypothetical protein